ncbi:hypothetical protein T484DRAFT_2316989 [Baffinella frigidus]|nr:hypothetical protein T484DRAFT_2316989 [Cryptophyta sp. CCMP2293]
MAVVLVINVSLSLSLSLPLSPSPSPSPSPSLSLSLSLSLADRYRGVVPTLIGIVPYAAINFSTYEYLKTSLQSYPELCKANGDPVVWARLACGAIAGSLGQTVVYPLDTDADDDGAVHAFAVGTRGEDSGSANGAAVSEDARVAATPPQDQERGGASRTLPGHHDQLHPRRAHGPVLINAPFDTHNNCVFKKRWFSLSVLSMVTSVHLVPWYQLVDCS